MLFTARYKGSTSSETTEGYNIERVGGTYSVYYEVMRRLARGRDSSFDVILEHVNGTPWYSPLWSSIPTVAYLYHRVGSIFFQSLVFPLGLAGVISERTMSRFYRTVPAACLGQSSRLEFARLGFDVRNIRVVPPGVDRGMYHRTSEKTSVPSLIMIGPIKVYKRFDIAVDALARVKHDFPDVKLTIIGDDPNGLVPGLEARARSLGIQDSVRFPGRVSDSEKVSLLSRSWSLLYASEREGWGLGITEAAACGTPAIAPRVGGMMDAISDGQTGLFFRQGSVESLAHVISGVIAERELRTRLSRAAEARASTLTWNGHVEEIERMLATAVDESRMKGAPPASR